MMIDWTQHNTQLTELTHQLDDPFFYYDLDAFSMHAAQLNNGVASLWYALKANPLSAVIQALDTQHYRFDVASSGELRQVLRQGVAADRIINTGPAKSYAQLAEFLQLGVRYFVISSYQQLQDLNTLAEQLQVNPQVLLRVQLCWDETDQSNVLGGDQLTPFGLSPENWSALDITHYQHVRVLGFHIFQWGNILQAAQLVSIWEKIIPVLINLAQTMHLNLRVLDLGGGLGIPYSATDMQINWDYLNDFLKTITHTYPSVDIWLELGRYLIGPYGCYLVKVVDRKISGGKTLLVLSGGINHLLRPAITQQAFPASLLRHSSAQHEEMQLHGPLCTALDCLGTHLLPADIEVGDWIVISQCGAYGFTESTPWFLCHNLPGEVVYRHNETQVIRRPEQPEVWMR